MEFFVIRVRYLDGDWSPPWSIFSSDYHNALHRFDIEVGLDGVGEFTLKNRPITEMSFYGRTDVGGGALQHPDIIWSAN